MTSTNADETFYVWEHGGNRGESSYYDTVQEAFEDGEAYAESHRRQWGFRHHITVIKVTDKQVFPTD